MVEVPLPDEYSGPTKQETEKDQGCCNKCCECWCQLVGAAIALIILLALLAVLLDW